MEIYFKMRNKIQKVNDYVFVKFKYIFQKINKSFPIKSQNFDKKIIFVAGNQRSGTNMVMDILEKSIQTDVFHETDKRAFHNYQMHEMAIIKGLFLKTPAQYFVIKALCESQEIKSFLEMYDNAKAVWVIRNYNDVINSMVRSFDHMVDQAERIAKDKTSSGWLGLGMSEDTHQFVQKAVKSNLDNASASALQWYYRNILFFDQKLDKDQRVKLIKYENLVCNPVEEFGSLFDFIGIKFSPSISNQIYSSSIKKNSTRRIDPEIQKKCDQLTEQFEEILKLKSKEN